MANAECRAIQKKRSLIEERIATATDLTWFSGKLRENEFIDLRKASSVTSMQGVSTPGKVSQLLDAVEAKIKHSETPHKLFNQFVAIFESEVLNDVSQILYKTRQDCATSCALPESDSREDGVGEDSTNEPAASLSARQNSSATWSTIPVQPAQVSSFETESCAPGANVPLPTFHSPPVPIATEKNESAAELDCADGVGHDAVRIATDSMSVSHHENGTTMRSSVMVHVSTAEQIPTPQSDSSYENLIRPIWQREDRLLEKEQQIASLEAEIVRLRDNESTLLREKYRINEELTSVKSCYESTLIEKDDEHKEKMSLKEQEIDRMREELSTAYPRAKLEMKEQYEALVQELRDQLKEKEKLCQQYCISKKIHELELKLKDKDVELERRKREIAEKESQVRVIQLQCNNLLTAVLVACVCIIFTTVYSRMR